jgi:hypothetical protein
MQPAARGDGPCRPSAPDTPTGLRGREGCRSAPPPGGYQFLSVQLQQVDPSGPSIYRWRRGERGQLTRRSRPLVNGLKVVGSITTSAGGSMRIRGSATIAIALLAPSVTCRRDRQGGGASPRSIGVPIGGACGGCCFCERALAAALDRGVVCLGHSGICHGQRRTLGLLGQRPTGAPRSPSDGRGCHGYRRRAGVDIAVRDSDGAVRRQIRSHVHFEPGIHRPCVPQRMLHVGLTSGIYRAHRPIAPSRILASQLRANVIGLGLVTVFPK